MEYKLAVQKAAEQARETAARKYKMLRMTDPAVAERFLAKVLNRAEQSLIALLDHDAGMRLNAQGMLTAVQRELEARASQSVDHDKDSARENGQSVVDCVTFFFQKSSACS